MEYTVERTVRFTGSDEERDANRATHNFFTYQWSEDDCETRCMDCDCRPSSAAAGYPCGVEGPREIVHYRADGTTKVEPVGVCV